ncbi:MAG: LysE family translocator [Sulfitobacter sp.]|jgi:threonine/homoserine/homoserine lactone efflux protein|uniref:LysE family translocator n=1 Tax=Sulfitobacter sp. TaxID=1903071 RepID=UPI000C496215|nr:lysine transporter LysE [Roseobacter sp.]MBV50382.1 lysine transporter LysE [Roseobacter sp.]|tara:strand:- start:4062 stop:4652 length:591 start_codon:yes stop_codon:yes gene_type:complete
MLQFALAVFFLIVTPGPGVLSTAGVGAAFGFRAGLAYVMGLFVGNNTVATLVLTGIAAIAFTVPWLRGVLLVASVLYLLWLAWRIARAGAKIGFIAAQKPLGFWNGLSLQLINPKAYVVHTTLFSGFGFFGSNIVMETVLKLLIMNLIWIPLHLAWLWAGVSLRRMDLSARTQSRVNFAMALSMLVVVGLALISQV